MGRLTKEMKKAELMEQLTEANETYLEKTSQHMECQYREMQRVERRIERKKKLIDRRHDRQPKFAIVGRRVDTIVDEKYVHPTCFQLPCVGQRINCISCKAAHFASND